MEAQSNDIEHNNQCTEMNNPEEIIETLRQYSDEASTVLQYLENYDYRQEAEHWDRDSEHPKLIEPEHPTLIGLYRKLIRFTKTIYGRDDNIDPDRQLNRDNITEFATNLQASQNLMLAERLKSVRIEPIGKVAEAFGALNRKNEERQLGNIYQFAYGIRKWYRASKNNQGTVISINLELNYEEATPAEISQDTGYKTFADLFNPSCNYSTSQKRALYNSLKALYDTIEDNAADKTVMAVILLFRNSKKYRKTFSTSRLSVCKENAMASLGRSILNIKSYSDNSLDTNPKLGKEHVKRAESLIAAALEKTR